MTSIIEKVADIIDERDREGLEVTLARVTFQLAGARALTMWRVFRRSDGVWLRKRVVLPETENGCEPHEDDVALERASALLRRSFETKKMARARRRPGSPVRCALPIQGAMGVLGLIEVELDVAMDRASVALLSGMLRVYRSHLAALDYGDKDELTGLANRRTFDDQFRRFVAAEGRRNGVRRVDDSWSAQAHLGVADIDFFKQINDRFGHPYGDEVLVLFAGLMRETFRDSDKLFRFGGEEFLILMSNCSVEDALLAFERFRAVVEAFSFPQVGKVTVSLGMTSLKLHDTGSSAFGRADQALYQAKRGGRNRVMYYESMELAQAPQALQPAQDIELF